MPKQKRNNTEYKGVYFVELSNGKKSFFIRYKHNGKSFEESVGKSDEGWNPEKAFDFRKKMIFEIGVKHLDNPPLPKKAGANCSQGRVFDGGAPAWHSGALPREVSGFCGGWNLASWLRNPLVALPRFRKEPNSGAAGIPGPENGDSGPLFP